MNQWYYGIADCHGIESFVLDVDESVREIFFTNEENKQKTSQQFAMCLRAQANQQRHAVVYRALIPEGKDDEIEKTIKAGDYARGLQLVKEYATEVMVGTYGTTKKAAEKNWKMIPNPDLDPYHEEK